MRDLLLRLLRRSFQTLLRHSFTFAHSDPHLTRQTAPTRGPRCRRSQRLFHPFQHLSDTSPLRSSELLARKPQFLTDLDDAGALEIEIGDQVETVGA